MRRLLSGILLLAAGCSSGPSAPSPGPRASSTPPPSPSRAVDLAVNLDNRAAVRFADGRISLGPITGPLIEVAALRGAIEVAITRGATCARFADETVRCASDAGHSLPPPRPAGVRGIVTGSEIRAATAEGHELWLAGARGLFAHPLPAIDGEDAVLPPFESFDLERNWGCGVAGGIAFCWGQDMPFFAAEVPDDRGDWGQRLFRRPRSVAPSAETRQVELYRNGICLLGEHNVLRECRGTIDVGSGSLTRCPVATPCRCGSSPGRTRVACEGRGAEPTTEITTWVDGVVVLSGGRCFITAAGAAGCFDATGAVTPLADLPLP